MYESIKNFDRNYLICYDGHVSNDGETNGQNILLISKQDGSTHTIEIPFDKPVVTAVISKTFQPGVTWGTSPESDYPLIPYQDKWILVEPSSDTLYVLSTDLRKKPLIVRKPSIQNMNPEHFLFLSIATDRYYFMETMVKEYDFYDKKGYPSISLVYDKQEKTIFKCIVYNEDYTYKQEIKMNYYPINREIASCHILPAHELVTAYKQGQLKGRLKEVAANLNEESNPVLMFYKYKQK